MFDPFPTSTAAGETFRRLRRPKNLAGEIRRAANRTYARAAVTRLEVRTTGVERGVRARRLVARVAFAYGRRAIVVDARLKPTFLRTLTSRIFDRK